MQVIIHIGIEKTGTTTIQTFLQANRERLQARGVYFSQVLGQPSQRYLAIMARDVPEADRLFDRFGIVGDDLRRQTVADWRAEWDREIDQKTGNICLISSEHLQSSLRYDSEIDRLAEMLRARFTGEFRVIVYIRDQLDQALSARSTAMKSGSSTYDIKPPQRYPGLDFRVMVERWGRVFGEAALSVRLFDSQTWPDGDLISDFMAACNLDIGGLDRPATGRNQRLDALGQRVLRHFNLRVSEFPARDQMILRAGLIAFAEQHFVDGPDAGVSADLIDEFREHFAASNEWVRARYFPSRKQLFAPCSYPAPMSAEADQETERMIRAFVENWIAQNA